MINGFEEQTHELTDYEQNEILPLVLKGLEVKVGKTMAVKNKDIVSALKSRGLKVGPARIRKVIHHIRINGLIECLVATSKGYYISKDKKELESYVESLHQRIDSITSIAKQLEFQKNKL